MAIDLKDRLAKIRDKLRPGSGGKPKGPQPVSPEIIKRLQALRKSERKTAEEYAAAEKRTREQLDAEVKELRMLRIVAIGETLTSLINFAGPNWDISLKDSRDQIAEYIEKDIIPQLELHELFEVPEAFGNEATIRFAAKETQLQYEESVAVKECVKHLFVLCRQIADGLKSNSFKSKLEMLNLLETHRNAIFAVLERYLSHRPPEDRRDLAVMEGQIMNYLDETRRKAA
jgi:hypothetical protein